MFDYICSTNQLFNKYMSKSSPFTIPQTGNKNKKSVKLTDNELQLLKELRVSAYSDTAFSQSFNIDRVSLIRIITIGSGSVRNINKIRKTLKQSLAHA